MITTALAVLSWVAVLVGFAGMWVCGRHRTGWLIGCVSSLLWLGFDLTIRVWAGVFACVVGVLIGIRNYHIGRPPTEGTLGAD